MKQIKLDDFSNVVPGGIAVCNLNTVLGAVLEKITMQLGGTSFNPGLIETIKIKANGKEIWYSTGADLKKTNAYSRGEGGDVMLKIDMMNRKALTLNGFHAGAWDLSVGSGITSLRLEIKISGDAENPHIEAVADVTPPTSDPAEASLRWLMARRHVATQTIGAAGTFSLNIPHLDPSGGGSVYRRIYIHAANMTGIKVIREGVTEFELTKAQNDELQEDNGYTPQDGLFVFDPVQRGLLFGDAWDTRYDAATRAGVRSAQIYGTFSAAGSVVFETEELIPLGAY